jgi:hypothetical protein
VRRRGLLLDDITLVGPYAHAGMPADDDRLGADRLHRIAVSLIEGVEISSSWSCCGAARRCGRAPYEAVRDAVAADLATGIVEPVVCCSRHGCSTSRMAGMRCRLAGRGRRRLRVGA